MKIKAIPMRTVTYLGVDVQIPAHHTAVAADGCGQVYSYAGTPIEITTCWRSSNSYERNDSCAWEAIHLPVSFYSHMEYRLKPEPPKTIRIGEYDVPEPVREPLENGAACWYPKLSNIDLIDGYIWCNDDTDVRMLSNGLIHLTKEAAVIHAKALLSLTKAAE